MANGKTTNEGVGSGTLRFVHLRSLRSLVLLLYIVIRDRVRVVGCHPSIAADHDPFNHVASTHPYVLRAGSSRLATRYTLSVSTHYHS